jgi:hypothetical protein
MAWRDDVFTLRGDIHKLAGLVTEVGEACLALAREPDSEILARAAAERAGRESYQQMNLELVREIRDIRASCAFDVCAARAESASLRDQLLEAGIEPAIADPDADDKSKRALASLRDELGRVADAARRVVSETSEKRKGALAHIARRQRSAVTSPSLASIWASLSELAKRGSIEQCAKCEDNLSGRQEAAKLRAVADNALKRLKDVESDAANARATASKLSEQYDEWLKSFDLERQRSLQSTRITAGLADHSSPLSGTERAAVRVCRLLLDSAGSDIDPFGYMCQLLLATCPLAVVRVCSGMQSPASSKLVRELTLGRGAQCASYLGAVHILARHIGGDVAWSVTEMSCVHASALGCSDPLFAAFGRARKMGDPTLDDSPDAELLSSLVRARLRIAASIGANAQRK